VKTIAIANQKGGVGKTATAVNLAVVLKRMHKKRVLLVDLDAQANATQWLLGEYGKPGRVVYDVLMEKCEPGAAIIQTKWGVDLIPSNLSLASLDIDLIGEYYREGRLKSALESLDDDRYHYVIVDCPPNLGVSTVNAFAACQAIIITIECAFEALDAVVQLMHALKRARQKSGSLIPYALPTFFDRTNVSRDVLEQIRERFESLTLPPINRNIKIKEAFAARQPIIEYDSASAGAVDYIRVAKELIDDLEKASLRKPVSAAN
jgi:chromosome partitioning protein